MALLKERAHAPGLIRELDTCVEKGREEKGKTEAKM